MSADGDTVREAMWHEDEALAALARLEAAAEKYRRAHEVAASFANDKLIPRAVAAESQRDALADALRRIAETHRLVTTQEIARAALAEAGLE